MSGLHRSYEYELVEHRLTLIENKIQTIAYAIQDLSCMTDVSVEDEGHKKWLAKKLNSIYEAMKTIIND